MDINQSCAAWVERSCFSNESPETMLSIQSELTRCIVSDLGQDAALQYLAELTGCTVVLEDFGSTEISVAHGAGSCCISRNHLSFKSSVAVRNPRILLERLCRPYSVTDVYPEETVYRLVAAITPEPSAVFLSFLSADVALSNQAAAVMRMSADFLAILTTLDRRIAKIELRLRGNFIEDLIAGINLDYDSIMHRSKALSYDIMQPHRVLVGELDESSFVRFDGDASRYRAEIVKSAQAQLDKRSLGLAFFRNRELIILFRHSGKPDVIDECRQFAETLTDTVAKSLKLSIYIGIGSACAELEDYKSSYVAAKKALEIGGFMITEGQVRSFEQFKVHALFLSTLKPEEQLRYAKDQLGELLDYDTAHNTELVKTLQEFLYLRNNIEGTAKSINMSVSGLKYRLKKIEQIIGKELHDNKVSFDLQLALVIFQLFGEYRIRSAD